MNIAHAIQNASHRAFNALTKSPDPAKHKRTVREDTPSPETMRERQRIAFNNWRPYPDGVRYHVTLESTFNARRSILGTSSENHALTYAHYKLNAMHSTGALRGDTELYVWDLGAPSGTLMPIAKFRFNDGEVERV